MKKRIRCRKCKRRFWAERSTRKYCSNGCRQAAYRARAAWKRWADIFPSRSLFMKLYEWR